MITRIDITDFITGFNAFIRDVTVFTFKAIKKYWLSFTLILFLMGGAFTLYWYKTPRYFESDLVCDYNNQILLRKVYGEMAQKLNVLAH